MNKRNRNVAPRFHNESCIADTVDMSVRLHGRDMYPVGCMLC
jgi:hypothetical protein